MSGHQQMLTVHPEFYAKWLAQHRPIYAGQIAAEALPIVPASQPTEPIINPEMRMRMIQASTRINPDGQKAVYVPPPPVSYHGSQPTNPEIIERLRAYGEVGYRPWYPVPYVPYRGWPNRYLEHGINV